jgi:ribonuclease Z
MKLTFLGTGSATPSRSRNVSALALQLDQRPDWWLIDCGEATQHQIVRSPLSLSLHRLRRIFITHLHGDHCFGLPGLLASRGLQGGLDPLDIHGPPGLTEMLTTIQRVTGTRCPYPLNIHEAPPSVLPSQIWLDEEEYVVRVVEVPHGPRTFSLIFEEKQQQGRFRIEDAQALGIPAGPLYARLKNGEHIQLADGREIDGKTLVDPPRPGRKLVIVSDTVDGSPVLPFAQDADGVVHESTYLESVDADLAREHRHSTAAAAGRFAATVKAKKLVLTHFSPRYDRYEPDAKKIIDLVQEARSFFDGEVFAAADFMSVEIPRRV